MTTISGVFDTKLIIYDTNGDGVLTGTFSKYINTKHPGTGNYIKGWQWDSRTWPSTENDYSSTIPTIIHPDLSNIDDENFQSGIGNPDDLEVLSIDNILRSGVVENWSPRINHGYFYQFRDQNFLYSDAVRVEYPTISGVTTSGYSHLILHEYPKNNAPVQARSWIWNSSTDEYVIDQLYNKKVKFTGRHPTLTTARLSTFDDDREQILWNNIDIVKNEFVIINSGDANPYVIFNKNVHRTIGTSVNIGSDLLNLEIIGVSSGVDKQQFHTKYSPIDTTTFVELFTYATTASWQQWSIVHSGVLVHSGHKVKLDPDLGIFYFGASNEGDAIPTSGHNIAVRYSTTAEIVYEPENTTNLIIASDKQANLNPISKINNKGFIVLRGNETFPAHITLKANLPTISLNTYGPQDIGSQYLKLTATVTSKTGEAQEGFPVKFYLLDTPSIGLFTNGLSSISSVTDEDGEAFAFYNPPKTIDDISELITISGNGFGVSGGNTTLTTHNLKVTSKLDDIYLYKVWKDDPVTGIPLGNQVDIDNGIITTAMVSFYQSFFDDEDIFGPTGLDPIATSGTASWEQRHRIITGLITPKNYNRLLRNGRKQIVSVFDTSAIDPHINEYGAYRPLLPNLVTKISDRSYNVKYNGIVLSTPESGDLDSYLLISPCDIMIRASVYDEINDKTLYSDAITVKLHIPNKLNGTINIDNVNTLPSGIVPYILTGSQHNGRILPLGFRLKSSGVTFAAAIGGVTYVDINPKSELMMSFNIDQIR